MDEGDPPVLDHVLEDAREFASKAGLVTPASGRIRDDRSARRGHDRRLRTTGGRLFLAGATGELDQVLVELEPDAVVAVDAW